jgi:hypothetical protein
MRTNARPTRRGVAHESTVRRSGGRGDRARSSDEFPTYGSAALAPDYDARVETDFVGGTVVEEPVRTRTAAQRKAADEAAQRRAAERVALASRRRLRVAPPLPVQVARAPFVASLLGIVVLGVIGILVLNTMINANQFRLNNLQTQQAGLDKQEQGLREKLAHQEAPGSLVAAAKCLGLVPAGSLAYIKMPNGTVVGVPAPASRTASVTHQPAADSDPSTAACIDAAMEGN